MESIQIRPLTSADDLMAAANEDVPAVSFEHVEGLVPLTERAAADLLAGSGVQSGLSRQVFGSIVVISETFKIFGTEQELRRHPVGKREWLLRLAELLHVIRQNLFDVKFVLGQSERRLRALAVDLERFNEETLTLARGILSPSSFEFLIQSRHTFPSEEEQSQRNLEIRRKITFLALEKDSASESGSGNEASEAENRKLRKKVKELEQYVNDLEEEKRGFLHEKVELQRTVQNLQTNLNSSEYKSSNMESVVLDLEERNRKLTQEVIEARRSHRSHRHKQFIDEPGAHERPSEPASAASTPRNSSSGAYVDSSVDLNRAEGGYPAASTRWGATRERQNVHRVGLEETGELSQAEEPRAASGGGIDGMRFREAASEHRATNRPPTFDQSYKKTTRKHESQPEENGAKETVGNQTGFYPISPINANAGLTTQINPPVAMSIGPVQSPTPLLLEPESKKQGRPFVQVGSEPHGASDGWQDDSSARSPPRPPSWQRGLIQEIVGRQAWEGKIIQSAREDAPPDTSDSHRRRRRETGDQAPAHDSTINQRDAQEDPAPVPERPDRSRSEAADRGEQGLGAHAQQEETVLRSRSRAGRRKEPSTPLPGEVTFSSFLFGVPGSWEDQVLEGRLREAVWGAVSGFDAFPSGTFRRFKARANYNRLRGDSRPTYAFCDFASKLAKECFDDGVTRGRLVLRMDTWMLPVQKARPIEMESVSHWEQRALDELWAGARGAPPETTLYARFLGEGAGAGATEAFEELLRTVVRTNVEGDRAEGIEGMKVAGKHAYVFLESESVGDELFRRLSDGDSELERKLFICRRKDYVPAPGVLTDEQINEERLAGKGSNRALGYTRKSGGEEEKKQGSGIVESGEAAAERTSFRDRRDSEDPAASTLNENRRRMVFVNDLPPLSGFEQTDDMIRAVEEAIAGFDALPPASLTVHRVIPIKDKRSGFVEMSSVLGADLFLDASTRGQIPTWTGSGKSLFVPRQQKWTMEVQPPPAEEQREQNELWQEAQSLNPAAVAYVRFARDVVPRKRGDAVRKEIERLIGSGENGSQGRESGGGIEHILCAGRHAYVAFRSEGAADEFFLRVRASVLEARMCFVRHRAYLPGPGMFVAFRAPDSFFNYRRPATVASFMAPPRGGLLNGNLDAEEKAGAGLGDQGFDEVPSAFVTGPSASKPPPPPAAASHPPSAEGSSPRASTSEKRQREVFLKDLPTGTSPESVRTNLTALFADFLSGFDAKPRALLAVRGLHEGRDSHTGTRVAYVELASVLATQLVSDALDRGPSNLAVSLRCLRDEEGVSHKIFIPFRQKWMLEAAEPTAAEIETLRALSGTVRGWDLQRSAYVRKLGVDQDAGLSERVREAVRAYTGRNWELEVLPGGRHAFVRFPSGVAADEFFDRPQEKEWDSDLFICRHRAYLPAPALFLVPLPSSPYASNPSTARNAEPQEPQKSDPVKVQTVVAAPAKPPAVTHSEHSHREAAGAADAAAVWSHDMYEAEYADSSEQGAVPKEQGAARKETRASAPGDLEEEWGPLGMVDAVFERPEARDGAGRVNDSGEEIEEVLQGWPESKAGEPAEGWADVGAAAADARARAARKERKLEVAAGGWKKQVDRWANPFSKLVGFEEEIVPPSSIHQETVRVRGWRNGKEGSEADAGRESEEAGSRRGTRTAVGEAERSNEKESQKSKAHTEGVPSDTVNLGFKNESEKSVKEAVESPGDFTWIEESGWQPGKSTGASLGNVSEEFGAAIRGQGADSSDQYGEELSSEGQSELFGDVPAGFEAEPERTETPEWSEEPGPEVNGEGSQSIGVDSFFGAQDLQGDRMEEGIALQGAAVSVEFAGREVSYGAVSYNGAGKETRAGQTETWAPSKFELPMEYVDRAKEPETFATDKEIAGDAQGVASESADGYASAKAESAEGFAIDGRDVQQSGVQSVGENIERVSRASGSETERNVGAEANVGARAQAADFGAVHDQKEQEADGRDEGDG